MNIALGRRIMVVASAITLGAALLLGGIAGRHRRIGRSGDARSSDLCSGDFRTGDFRSG